MNKAILRYSKGFTLIEIIITIVIAAIAALVIVTFMGKNITSSSVPVTWVKNQNEVNQAMENIVSEYKARIAAMTLNLGTFQAWVNANGPTGGSVSATMVSYPVGGGAEASSCTYGAAGSCTLKVTLTKDNLSVTGLFTD